MFTISIVMLALQTMNLPKGRFLRSVHTLLIVQTAMQLFFLDPGIHSFIYLKGVGPFANIRFAQTFFRVLPRMIGSLVNIEICLSTIGMLVSCFQQPRALLPSAMLQTIFFCGISMLYLFLFRWIPDYHIWISRVASYVGFKSLPVSKPTKLNAYVSVVSMVLIICFTAASVCQLRSRNNRSKRESIFFNRISAADTASRVFCHCLKNELLAQQAELNMLAMTVPESLRSDVHYIIQRNNEISHRLTVLRETIKQQKLNIEPINLCELLREVYHKEKEDPAIQLRLSSKNLWVDGSADQLKEMLHSLIQNARETRIPGQEHPVIVLSLTPLRRYANLVVSNNGARISARDKELIFEPFYTTKSTKSNWGLGLSLCRNIITLHHGQIWVDEESTEEDTMTSFHMNTIKS